MEDRNGKEERKEREEFETSEGHGASNKENRNSAKERRILKHKEGRKN